MIDRWRIVLTDENGVDLDLEGDLPDYITKQIDEIVEVNNAVTWSDNG